MNCPVCNVELRMSERQGIEIDYCPQCRGIWLDRGELDKIIERAKAEYDDYDDDDYIQDNDRAYDPYSGKAKRQPPTTQTGDRGRDPRPRRRKKFDFLDDLFDFDLFD